MVLIVPLLFLMKPLNLHFQQKNLHRMLLIILDYFIKNVRLEFILKIYFYKLINYISYNNNQYKIPG